MDDGGALCLHQTQGLGRVKTLHQNLPRAGHNGDHGGFAKAVNVEHRQIVDDGVGESDAEAVNPVDHTADDNVAVHRALGTPRGAGGVTERDDIFRLDSLGTTRKFTVADCFSHLQHFFPAQHAGFRCVAKQNHTAQHWKFIFSSGRAKIRQIFTHHGEIIDRPGTVHGNPSCAIRLLHRVGNISGPVARVERHQNRADFGDGIHKKQPFGAVEHP